VRFRSTTVLAALLFGALRAAALDHSAATLHLPAIAHTTGVNDSKWRSDLVLNNRHEHLPTIVALTYEPVGGDPILVNVPLLPRQTVTLRDVVGNTFAAPGTYGTLVLVSLNASIHIRAHVRIYNTGNAAGEFGQSFTAMPLDQLGKTVWLYGLNGIDGNRTNIGIANPNDTAAPFTLAWYDKDGEFQGGVGAITIEPHGLFLINDIFRWVVQPNAEAMTLKITSSEHLYAYASVVRNDTGDAYTLVGEEATP
jgi:hypothetical protein